jgi:hypothetical protein
MTTEFGTVVEARTASGDFVRMRALGAPTRGKDFPVLWVCTEDEYERATSRGEELDGIPWPLDAARVPTAA